MIYVPIDQGGFANRDSMTINEPETGEWAPYDETFNGFYKPKWNDEQWIEGATPEEIEAMTPPPETAQPTLQQEIAELKQLVADLASLVLEVD